MQLLGYVQKAGVVPQRKSHVRVGLKVEIENDDLTFKLRGAFLDTVPEDWSGLKAGEPIAHAADASNIVITRICGPVERVGPDTWALRFYRGGFDNPKRSGGASYMLSHPGDDLRKPMALEAEMKFGLTNRDGLPQKITFNLPVSLPAGGRTLELSATSDAGLPVFFMCGRALAWWMGRPFV